MTFITNQEAIQVIGGVDIFSLTGLIILFIGILFTIGIPLIMIFKGKKDWICLAHLDRGKILVTNKSKKGIF